MTTANGQCSGGVSSETAASETREPEAIQPNGQEGPCRSEKLAASKSIHRARAIARCFDAMRMKRLARGVRECALRQSANFDVLDDKSLVELAECAVEQARLHDRLGSGTEAAEAKKLAARAFSKAAANDITNIRGFARLAIDEAVHLVLDWHNFEDGEEIARIGVDLWEMVAEETGRPEDYRELAEAYGMLQDIATGNCASSECLSELAEKEHAAREIVSRYSPKR